MAATVRLLMLLAALAVAGLAGGAALAQEAEPRIELVPPAEGQANNIEIWRAVRGGTQGTVSIPDARAGLLLQSEGEAWRSLRNGPLSTYGSWLLLGTVAVLALFFALRGRIRIEAGRSGRNVSRFSLFERSVHWLTAASFIILGLSGLNTLYGRYVIKDLIGAESFAALSMAAKVAHTYVGFLFIACLVVVFVMWIRNNLPTLTDLTWLARGGGFIGKAHPPAYKFNAGQKIVFWMVILGGAVVSYTGLNLVFPFAYLATVQDMQATQLLHAVAALVMMAMIIAHIYIGTLGMEGAFEAMWEGTVDESWAREHHSLWQPQAEASDGSEQAGPAE